MGKSLSDYAKKVEFETGVGSEVNRGSHFGLCIEHKLYKLKKSWMVFQIGYFKGGRKINASLSSQDKCSCLERYRTTIFSWHCWLLLIILPKFDNKLITTRCQISNKRHNIIWSCNPSPDFNLFVVTYSNTGPQRALKHIQLLCIGIISIFSTCLSKPLLQTNSILSSSHSSLMSRVTGSW